MNAFKNYNFNEISFQIDRNNVDDYKSFKLLVELSTGMEAFKYFDLKFAWKRILRLTKPTPTMLQALTSNTKMLTTIN